MCLHNDLEGIWFVPLTNGPDLFKRWLYGGFQDLGEAAVTELLLDWIDPFITRVERDRMVAWYLGVSL